MTAAHLPTHRRKHQPHLVAIVVVSAALVLAAGALVVTKIASGATPSNSATAVAATIPPLAVSTTTPATGTTGVQPGSVITVSFSASLAASTPLPTLSPQVPGSWTRMTPSSLAFEPTSSFSPGTAVTVTVPGGSTGVVGAKGQHLRNAVTTSFTMAPMSMLRVQELLAQLDYLPLSFTPGSTAPSASALAADQPGTFAWRWSTLPAELTSQWVQGQANTITRGAIMMFESQHNLTTDGLAGPQVWAALLAAAQANQANADPHWDWVDVTTSLPETVHVWRDGQIVYTTLGNTGVPGATTELGTFPVYSRFLVTTMKGTNPDGSHYSDPGIPWVSYFNGGDALHGFVRASYGFPQSDGCVEMPPANAEVVFPYTPIGTLVTVQ
jgi:L,D-transpeptidase catalytic domain/Bacterial Ig-like domain